MVLCELNSQNQTESRFRMRARRPDPGHLRLNTWQRIACIGVASAFANAVVPARAAEPSKPAPAKNVAAIVTVYHHNSHADVIVSRLLQTDTLDGKGKDSPLKLVSLYTDQRPANDM